MEPTADKVWKLGEIYIVRSPSGGVMGRLLEIHPIELVFEMVDCGPMEIPSASRENVVFKTNGIVIVSRYTVSRADRVTQQTG